MIDDIMRKKVFYCWNTG